MPNVAPRRFFLFTNDCICVSTVEDHPRSSSFVPIESLLYEFLSEIYLYS